MSPFSLGILGSARVAAAGWSPLDLSSLVAWFDAADTASITASGGAVSAWASQVGTYSAAQATSGKQPATGTTSLNSLNVLAFDGGDALTVASLDLSATDEFSFFAVAKFATSGLQFLFEHGPDSNSSPYNSIYAWVSGWMEFGHRASDAETPWSNVTSGTFGATARSVVGTIDRALSTNEPNLYYSGTQQTTRPLNNNTSGNFLSRDLFIGARNASAYYLNGYIAELGVLTTAATTDERQKVEGYLSHKWGIAGDLPAGHPYKSNPPT